MSDTPAFDLHINRAFADDLRHWLEHAAGEYGLAIIAP